MAEIRKEAFEKTRDGRQTSLYTLENKSGAKAVICDLGGIIRSIEVPDRDGKLVDVVLGYEHVIGNEDSGTYFGALVGRVGNRIAKGHFTLNGTDYELAVNNGANHLHGGLHGFNSKVWEAEILDGALRLSTESADMEEGYPGSMKLTVWYRWSEDNTLTIDYTAVSDADTICNLTNHSYFNLAGHDSGDVLEQELKIYADTYLPTDETAIPTGVFAPVAGTPFDFREAKRIGRDIEAEDEQIRIGRGYDHTFVLRESGEELPLAAEAYCSATGIILTCRTTQPGVQCYTGNWISEQDPEAKGGAVYRERQGFALETQNYPDAVNHPEFPSPVLKKGETYHTVTSYQFGVRK